MLSGGDHRKNGATGQATPSGDKSGEQKKELKIVGYRTKYLARRAGGFPTDAEKLLLKAH